MKRILGAALFGSTFLVPAAFAETSFGTGFTVDGDVTLNSYTFGSGNDWSTFVFGNVDVSWTNGTWGVDGSLFGYGDENDGEAAVFLALTYQFGAGKVSIGMPRAGYSEHGDFYFTDKVKIYAIEGFYLSGDSFLDVFEMIDESDVVSIFGVRYDGSFGATQVASSLHFSPDGEGFLSSTSAAYEMGEATISGGLEYLNVPGPDFYMVKLRYDRSFDLLDFGVGISSFTITDGGASESQTSAEVSLTYNFTDKISLGGSLLSIDSGGFGSGTTLWSVNGTYKFTPAASAELTVFDDDDGSSDDLGVNVALKYTF